jgi:hypothetical protein
MVVVPADTPPTTPLPIPTVATVVVLLVHVPPNVASLSVTVELTHSEGDPVIAAGLALTVSTRVVVQPVAASVNVIVVVPEATPLTTPVDEPAVATVVLPLTHVPAPEASLSVTVCPVQTDAGPDIAAGSAVTVSTRVVVQPVPVSVKVMVVVPMPTPVKAPVPEFIVATPVLPLIHVPVPVASDNVIVEPRHTVEGPEIAAGDESTVSTVVALQPVDVNVNVIVVVPDATPVITPVLLPAVAMVVLLLTHVPPPSASLNVTVEPMQREEGPEIADVALTVTVCVANKMPHELAAE